MPGHWGTLCQKTKWMAPEEQHLRLSSGLHIDTHMHTHMCKHKNDSGRLWYAYLTILLFFLIHKNLCLIESQLCNSLIPYEMPLLYGTPKETPWQHTTQFTLPSFSSLKCAQDMIIQQLSRELWSDMDIRNNPWQWTVAAEDPGFLMALGSSNHIQASLTFKRNTIV